MTDKKEVPKDFVRLVHPLTGDFIAEFYPEGNYLIVTKHKKTAVIDLTQEALNYARSKANNSVNDDL